MPLATKRAASVLLALPFVVACATGGGFADLASERDRIQDLSIRLEPLGRLPTGEVMAPDVQLVTFTFKTSQSKVERRDTIRSARGVEGWLEGWHARQRLGTEFSLTPAETHVCDGSVVQEGTFPMEASGPEVTRKPYRAQWMVRPDGRWVIHRIWLDPDSRARLSAIAEGCRSQRSVSRQGHRVVVDAEMIFGAGAAGTSMQDAMRAMDWTYSDRNHGFPTARVDPGGFALGVTYKLTPDRGIQALFVQPPRVIAAGRLKTVPVEPQITAVEHWLALLGSMSAGPLNVAVGPAVAMTRFDWIDNLGWYGDQGTASGSQVVVGGIAQASVVAPVTLVFRPRLLVRYSMAGAAEAPPYLGLEPFTMPLRRLTFGFGATYSF